MTPRLLILLFLLSTAAFGQMPKGSSNGGGSGGPVSWGSITVGNITDNSALTTALAAKVAGASNLTVPSGLVYQDGTNGEVTSSANLSYVSNILSAYRNGIAATPTPGIGCENSTAATSGVPVQYPCYIYLRGNVWDTTPGSSNSSTVRFEYEPSSAATPTGTLHIGMDTSGGGTFGDAATLTSAGTFYAAYLTASATMTAATASVGTMIASTAIRLPNTITPLSSDTCTPGTIGRDSSYVYLCIASGNWGRIAWITGY